MNEKYKCLFEQVKIGNVTVKNRFQMAPMGPLGMGDADELMGINGPLCSANRDMLVNLLPFNGVDVRLSTLAQPEADGSWTLTNTKTSATETISPDMTIYALGYVADNSRFEEVASNLPEVYSVGDCREPKNIHQAIWDAYEVANHI